MSDRTLPQDPAAGDDAEGTEDAKEQSIEQASSGGGSAAGGPALSRRERLAAAAEKRREQRSKERAQAASVGLDASERVDDALVRATDRTGRFVKRHFNVLQWVIVGVIAAWIGVQIYNYRTLKNQAKVGDSLAKAAQAALAGGKPEDDSAAQPGAPADPTPKFASDEERYKVARESFEAAIALKKSEGSVLLAELGLAGVELDQGKPGEARARYERVRTAPYAQNDTELRGRALEGIALTHEAGNDVEAALKAYRELENSGLDGFVEMALLSQARLQVEKGELPSAKDALDKLQKRLDKAEIKPEKTFYLGPTLEALKTLIDPQGPKPSTGEPGDMEDLQKTLQELSKKMGSVAPAGEAAPGEAPVPEAPAGEPPTNPAPVAPPTPAPAAPAPAPKAPALPRAPTTPPPAPAPQAPAPAPEPTPAPATPPGTPPSGQDPSGGTQ